MVRRLLDRALTLRKGDLVTSVVETVVSNSGTIVKLRKGRTYELQDNPVPLFYTGGNVPTKSDNHGQGELCNVLFPIETLQGFRADIPYLAFRYRTRA